MKNCIIIALLVIAAVSVGCQTHVANKPPAKDGVFIHVTHGADGAHQVAMALKMAELMSDTQDVAMYFDIKGIEVVLKDSANIEYKTFESSHVQLKKLLEKGVLIMACPGCLASHDKKPEDLLAGVEIASKQGFLGFTKGRILTLDY